MICGGVLVNWRVWIYLKVNSRAKVASLICRRVFRLVVPRALHHHIVTSYKSTLTCYGGFCEFVL